MTASGYTYDQGWKDERARLAAIEALWDAGTRALLARHGAVSGAAVLEAGAGGGSVVSWLAEQVGANGRVLAIDLDVRFVEPLRSPSVEVMQRDLVTDELPAGEFDVVHARMVLEHIEEREQVLDRLVRALRPGGTIVLEDYDWTGFGFDAPDDVEDRVTEGILALMTASGYDRLYGRRLVNALATRGLTGLCGEGRSLVIDDSHPGYAFFQLSFEQLAGTAIESGVMTEDDAATARERFRTGGRRLHTPALVAGVGRMPR